MNRRKKLISIWIQLALMAIGFFFMAINFDVSLTLWGILAYYQVLSAIYTRVRKKKNVGVGRWSYETILFVLALGMLTAFLSGDRVNPLTDTQSPGLTLFFLSLAGLSIIPKSMALWKSKRRKAFVSWGVFVVLLLIVGMLVRAFLNPAGFMMLGLFLMLLAGPSMACFYVITEYSEYDLLTKSNSSDQ